MKQFYFIGFMFLCFASFSQDVHFSQYQQAPLLLNPASAGFFSGSQRVILNYKNQWTGMQNPYKTMAASIDFPAFVSKEKIGNLGFGLNAYRDIAGDSKFGTTKVNLSVSGIVNIDKLNKISGGLQIGGGQLSADISNLQWGNQFTGTAFNTAIASNEQNSLSSRMYLDLGLGVMYEFSNIQNNFAGRDGIRFSVGVSSFHVNQPSIEFYSFGSERLQRKYVINGTGRFDIPETRVSLVPGAIYLRQGPSSELLTSLCLRIRLTNPSQITTFLRETALTIGAGYRNNDAIIPQFAIDFSDYSFGVSYDLSSPFSTTNYGINGGLEFFIRYTNWKSALFKGKR
ncbi:MAG: PorP/SprF family type IX secretion system membrane protein [Bacteroidetes bacterium]|nr:PorP/SprF family type IX secretion system membrane protein [Bacteroidota bacterium]HET6245490.1 PorP/SprF family type IX secretion system membrane protein [Bacteroidia bacterium]